MRDSPYRQPSVAATYNLLAAPLQFAAPAQDLVRLANLGRGARVLDVGAGTGVVTVPAAEAVGATGLVVALDPSSCMLRTLPGHSHTSMVIGRTPGLPFGADVFDAVLASFVVSHFENHRTGLEDMIRVCRPHGTIGITTWDLSPNPVGQLWREVAGRYVALEELQWEFLRQIPSEEALADVESLERALRRAGLTSVDVTRNDYRFSMTVTDYLSLKAGSVEGTLLRRMLDTDAWTAFTRRVEEAFERQFADTIEYVRDVNFGIGRKGDGT